MIWRLLSASKPTLPSVRASAVGGGREFECAICAGWLSMDPEENSRPSASQPRRTLLILAEFKRGSAHPSTCMRLLFEVDGLLLAPSYLKMCCRKYLVFIVSNLPYWSSVSIVQNVSSVHFVPKVCLC